MHSIDIFSFCGALLGFTVLIGLLAGSYPALFLSRFLPVEVLRGRLTSRLQAGFTKPLVVLQFALSAFLMISAIIMYRQMHYIATKDLGYDGSQILVISTQAGRNDESDRVVERFRNKVKNDPAIVNVAGTSVSFNRGEIVASYLINGETKQAYTYSVDPEYLEILNIKLAAGRNFDERIVTDTHAVIVNEAFVRDMHWSNPLQERFQGSQVIGVVKDYHFRSLEHLIEPMVLSMNKNDVKTMLVKIAGNDVPSDLDRVRRAWKELNPDTLFEYTFLDDDIARQYERYERWMAIAGLATVFAVVIASLGLFGLSGVNAINKTREIGIRKVMGAEIIQIFVLLNKPYVLMASIAFTLAAPFSWYVMDQWIKRFEFRITIGWELFAVSIVAAILIALLTISYHAMKAALINPAETLKHE